MKNLSYRRINYWTPERIAKLAASNRKRQIDVFPQFVEVKQLQARIEELMHQIDDQAASRVTSGKALRSVT